MTLHKTRRPRGGAAINFLIVLASIILPLAAVEIFLIWDNWRPRFERTSVELGGQEFRFYERPEALRDLRRTAAIIGDSFTAGAACGEGRNYPSYLAKFARQNGHPYQVVNLGVPGADPFMYLQVVEGLLATRRIPSLLLVTLYSNDIELMCSACKFLERIRNDPEFSADELAKLESFCGNCAKTNDSMSGHFNLIRQVHTWLHQRLHVYGLFRDALVRLSMRLGFNIGWGRTAYPALWQDHQSMEFRLLKFALAGIRDALGAFAGSQMMVVVYPDVENIRKDNVYVRIYQDVEDELSKFLGVPVFSGYPGFLNDKETKRNMPYSLTDHHPSCKAHEIFAKWVFVRVQDVLRPALSTRPTSALER